MLNVNKRIMAMLLVVAMLFSSVPMSAFAAALDAILDPESATEEELIKHQSGLLEVADQAGFAAEYELFFAVLEDLDERGEFYNYNNFALYCRSMSDELLLELLGYLRKYVNAGAKAGYSAVSATEEFFYDQMYNIYYTYFEREEFLGLIRAEDLKQFETTPMFTKDLPAYYYYPTEADLPNELELTVELSPAVMAAVEEIRSEYDEYEPYEGEERDLVWIMSTGDHYSENMIRYKQAEYVESVGNRTTLRLSADDILKFACDVQNQFYSSTGGFYVRLYAAGYLSDPCYIAIGNDAFFEGSPSYGSREQGSFALDFNTDRLPEGIQVTYEWNLSAAVPEWVLQGHFDDSMWDGPFTTTEPVLTVEDIENSDYLEYMNSQSEEKITAQELWDRTNYVSCNVEWEVDGELYNLNTPILPVFGGESGEVGPDRSWTYTPISTFEVFGYNTYVVPGATITSNVFTLADDAVIDCILYYSEYDYTNMSSVRIVISDQGTTFTAPESADALRPRTEYYVDYTATAPNGKTYSSGLVRELNVYPEDLLVYTGSGQYDEILGEQILHKDVAKSAAKTNIFSLQSMALYQNGILYTTDSSYSSTKLKVNWYTNTVRSYDGATLHSSGTTVFRTEPNTLGEYYVFCVVTAGDFSYTSEIFTYNVIDPAVLTENRYLITGDGTLYCVFSNDEVVTIPETINGITVKTIASDTFGSAGYGTYAYDRCPYMTTLILPDTVETLESGAVPHCVTTLELGDGIKHIEGLPDSIKKLVIPEGVETLHIPNVSVLEIQSPKTIALLNEMGKKIAVGTLILPEGLEIIGKGGLECAVTADEVVLPSTLKVFAPVKPFYVYEKMELPEGLEVFDAVQTISEYWDPHQGTDIITDYNFTYEGKTLVFPESLKTLGHPGLLWNVREQNIPEDYIPGEYYFERAGIESYVIPAGMTVIPDGLFMNSALRVIVIPEGVTEIGAQAFSGCSNLEKIVLSSTLTKIGDNAFKNCEALTELVIPAGVTTIGRGAFEGCSGIERVVVPASVTKLGAYAFAGCSSLQEVVIEAMMPTLEAGVFEGCSNLYSIQLQDGLQQIKYGAFAGCYGITSLDFLPESVSLIGRSAFANAGLEGELVLPAGLQELDGYAFSYTYVTSVRFNDRLKYIGEYAFKNTQLTSVEIPDSVDYIGSGAFYNSSLESITFGENIRYIGADAFRGTNLTEYNVPKKVTKLMGGTIAETPITHIDLDPTGEGVLSYVGPSAFAESGIVSIVFPDSVTYLGKGVCSYCYSLESVVLPGSLTRIREDSFYYCDALTTVQMSDQLKRIDGWAFYGCTSLNGIVLPDTLEIIGQSAFCDCTSLEIADLPAALTRVEAFSFRGTKLAKIELGENVAYVGNCAFQDCAEVTSITLNNKLGYIGQYAFAGCALVTELTIPESVNSIGSHFIKGTAIEEIVLPSGLSFIPAFTDNTVIKKVTCASTDIQHLSGSTFANCTALEEADVYSGEWIGSNCFLNCTSLKYFHAYYQTKEIRKSAFEGCSSMTIITFGGKDSLLETIGEKAFSGCVSITDFDLPETLESIGSRAFEKTSITSVIVPAKVRDIGSGPIYNEWSGTLMGYGDTCFYDCPELQRIVFVNRDGAFLPIYSFAEYCPKLAEVYLPNSVGWMSTENGFDMEIFDDPYPWLKNYNQAKLEGYVPTAYYRYGVYESDKDYSDWTFDSIYKPGDTFTCIPFTSDYDAEKAYWEFFNEQVELCKSEGYDTVEFVSLNEYLKPMTVLSSFGVKVMAGDEDITDKVQINWYINWLEDNILTTGPKLDGSAMVCDTFRYRFTVTLDEEYAFDYEDYDSGEFELKSTMDGQVVVVNLVEREKGAVQIELPEGVKDDPSVSVSVLQTQSNLLRELETEIVDGKITLQVAPSANLLVYVLCDDYYKYTGAVAAEDIQTAIDTATPHRLAVEMEKLPVSGTFTAKFSIYDIIPYGEEEIETLDSFDGISVEIKNVTKGTVCEDYTLQYPYVIINNYESFFDLTDELTITVTPDASLEMYGFTAVLNPGDSDNYGDTEGTLNRYGAMYISPVLPEDIESGRAIVQVYNAAGNRVSIDIVESGELLVRRFADGTYTVTVSEQNRYFNSAERLTQFTTCGWTAGEDYYRTNVTLEAPCYQVLDVETPLAPDSSFLIKQDPLVTRNDHLYNNWQLYNWPYYTELTFDVVLDTSFQLHNTTLLLSVPANMDLFHICQAEQEFGVHMTYTDRYLSDDGLTMYYEYPIGDLTQKEGRLNFMVYLRYNEDIISFDQITDQYCTATVITDATVDGTASRYYTAAGSISMLDEEMLSRMVQVSHAPTISDKTGITAMVTAPAGSEVDLYADGELVAQGITNYTGLAVLRYDAPFKWLWWEYEVYAVVRIANTGIEFTTDPVSVECNEDLTTPVKIEGEIVIRDAETGEVVFPTSYDPDNIISVNFKTGERKNIVLRSMLDSSDGKRYDIHETFRVTFDNNAAGYARDVAIVNRYTDVYGSEKEEYLWAEYNEDSDCYLSTKVIRNVAYDPATLLTVMQLPTHMGVEWETAADAVGITLMPGQMQAIAERLDEAEKDPFQELFGIEASLENTIRAQMNPVKTDPLFPYYPAQMQADIINDYRFAQDIKTIMNSAFTEVFGFNTADMSEEDYRALFSNVQSGAIDESVTAASLRERGFTEIPVYGEENGVFMTSTDSGIEVYDFSANYYMSYDTEAWMDVLNAYIPEQNMQVMTMRAAALSEGEAPTDSLSKYVDGIHSEYVAGLIDRTYDKYKESEEFLNSVIIKGISDLGIEIANKMQAINNNAPWLDFMFGTQNPTINGVNKLIGEGLSMLKELDPFGLEWDYRDNALINQYYDNAGNPCVELTETAYNYLKDSDLQFISGALGNIATEKLPALTGAMIESGISSAVMKEYNLSTIRTDALIAKAFGTGDVGTTLMDMSTYFRQEAVLKEAAQKGIINLEPVTDPYNPKNAIVMKVDSNIKGVPNSEALAIAVSRTDLDGNAIESAIFRRIDFKTKALMEFEAFRNSNSGKNFSKVTTAFASVVGAFDSVKLASKAAKAIDNMRNAYGDLVNKMLVLGELYAKVDAVYEATINDDKENMEYFNVYPLYQSSMTDQFGIGMIAAEEYESRLAFNMIFEGQAFVWMPAWKGYYDPDLGATVITDKYYTRYTLRTYFSEFAPFAGDLDEYFKDSKRYYREESFEYFTYLSRVRIDLMNAMYDLSSLCSQYNVELQAEACHMLTKLIGLVAAIPNPVVSTIASTAQLVYDKIIDGALVLGSDYFDVFSKAKTNLHNQSMSKLKASVEKYEELKRDLSTKGDHGDGVWERNGIRYVSGAKALELWDEMAEENWYYFTWYPSGREKGEHWEDDLSRYEPDSAQEEMVFTEEDVTSDLIMEALGTDTSYEMECSDPLIDPAGFIYEAVLSNRVEGATASIYYQDADGNAVLWDAEYFGQTSTIITQAGGYYSWLTPPGNWKVVVQKDGYLTADSTQDTNAVDGWLPVPPPQLNVNIGLVTTQAPTVADANGYAEGVLVQFSQYMDIASFNGAMTLMVDGEIVPCMLTFTDKEVSATDANVYYGRKLMVSRQDGQPLIGAVKVTVDGSVKNYAGIALGRDYTSEELTVKQYVSQIDMTYTNITVKPTETLTLEGRLLDAFGNPVAGRRIILSSNETHADLLNEIVYTDPNGYFTFAVEGKDIGFTVVEVCPDDSAVCAQVTVETERITALNQYTDSKSTLPYVTVIDPDGNYDTVQITESGVLTILEGSKLMMNGLGSGEIGYSTAEGDNDPWKCEDYTIYELPITAEEKTYRIVHLEDGKTYSDVLELKVLFAESHVHSLVSISAKDATCCTYGNIAHYSCSGCGMLFADAEGTAEIADTNAVWISAFGHDDPVYTVNGDTHSVDYPCCDLLDYTDREHEYVDHVCICGVVETFTVTFKYSNDILWQTEYPYNTILNVADIAIPDSPGDIYVWGGWHDAYGNPMADGTAVTSDLTFYAYWNYITYTVTWVVGDNRYEEAYEYGRLPYFMGSTDKEADGCISYTFIGWDQEIDCVYGDVTYTAQYEAGYSHVGEKEYTYVDENYHKVVCSACDMVLNEAEEHLGGDYCACGKMSSDTVATVSKNGVLVGAYTSIDDAVWEVYYCTAADEAVVTLMRDIELGDGNVSIYSGVFTIDLNGHEISSTSTDWGAVYISGASTHVTIQDAGESSKITGSYAGIICFDATLTITGGNIRGDNGVYGFDSPVIITGGNISGDYGVYAYNGTVTISDGTISGSSCGVRTSGSAVTINGGTIGGNSYGVRASNGSVSICGGSIRGGTYDLYNSGSTITLTAVENGVGAAFPGGISVYGTTLNEILGDGAAYYLGDERIVPADDATYISGGDVVINALDHSYSAEWSQDEENHWHECINCGDRKDENAHDYGDGNICVDCGYERSVTVSGTVTSFNSETDDITIELYAEGSASADYTVTVKGNTTSYSIEGVTAGTYTLRVSKANHVTREYTVVVGADTVLMDAKIHLKGDINGDGKANAVDVKLIYNHMNDADQVLTGYDFSVADVSGDGKVNAVDKKLIYNHMNDATKALW